MNQVAENFRTRDYWIVENAQYAAVSFRLRKLARIVNEMAGDRECSLLDVGCGPAALRSVLRPNVAYHGIDIAIHEPAPYLQEIDIAHDPIDFSGRSFDFVVAMGLYEYMGTQQDQKFDEVRAIMKNDGKFIMSYINFGHFRRLVWPNYNNVKPIGEMADHLKKVFHVERYLPVSHHWRQKQPGKRSLQGLQMKVNFNIPIITPAMAVEYFFVCSAKK